ncbi:hypothetical protein MRX96_004679 [Rhipicephalus microplus]
MADFPELQCHLLERSLLLGFELYADEPILERRLINFSLGFRLCYTTSSIDENHHLQGLTFADDIVLMAESTQKMQALLDIWQSEITRMGLCFKVKKPALLRLVVECVKEGGVILGDAKSGVVHANGAFPLQQPEPAGRGRASGSSSLRCEVWRKLAHSGNQLDSLLRDRFVYGINNPGMQTRLLELPDPSLDNVVKAALAMGLATKEAGEIARAVSTEAAVNKMAARGSKCSRCGDAPFPLTVLVRIFAVLHVQEKLGTLHEYAERKSRTADQSSSLDQAQVPHQPAVRVGTASGGGESAAAGLGSSAARLNVVTDEPPIFDMWHTGLVPAICATVRTNSRSLRAPHFHGTENRGQCVRHGWQTFSKGPSLEWPSRLQADMLRSYSGELS